MTDTQEKQPLFFLIAGEASGDLLGARLMAALKKRLGGAVTFSGIGGPRMRAEGIDLLFPQEELAHFGLFELLRHVPHLLKRMKETEQAIKLRRPAALITIDAPDFCFRVAKNLKGLGIPLIHYVAPTVWAWRPGRAKKIAQFLDHLLALLPFEPPYFTKEGLACTFAGHPIVEGGAGEGDGARFRAAHAISDGQRILVVLPGSRMSEVTRLMPIFRQTLELLLQKHLDLQIVIPAASNVANWIKAETAGWPYPVRLIEGDDKKYDAFAAAEVALACSGTVAVELAMAKVPSVIAYKISSLTYFLYRHLVKAKYANLVNIMHNRMVVPEYLQNECTAENLASALSLLLSDEKRRETQLRDLAEVASWLGKGQFVPSEWAADTVLKVANQKGRLQEEKKFAVLQVIPSLISGGVERGTIEVVAALVKKGHRAMVASSGGPLIEEVEAAGGTHIMLPLKSKNPFTMYANGSRLKMVIEQLNIDIVHARSRAPAFSARRAARSTGAAYVTTVHNAYGGKSWLKTKYNSIMASGDRVIAISEFVGAYAKKVHRVGEDRLRIIPRGVDIERFDPAKVSAVESNALRRLWRADTNVPVILLPGRLTRWKGHLVLIDALRLLGRKDFIVVMLGKGPQHFRAVIEKAARDASVWDIIRLMNEGSRNMPVAFMAADIVCAPSTRPEGFGRVIAEAQAMGRPVITTDHGGAKETVIAQKTGFLVPPNNPGALAEALTRVLAFTETETEAIGRQSIDHIRDNFTTSRMTAATLAVYAELMQTR